MRPIQFFDLLGGNDVLAHLSTTFVVVSEHFGVTFAPQFGQQLIFAYSGPMTTKSSNHPLTDSSAVLFLLMTFASTPSIVLSDFTRYSFSVLFLQYGQHIIPPPTSPTQHPAHALRARYSPTMQARIRGNLPHRAYQP